MNYYGVTRQTADVDFLITRSDFEKILPELEREGYRKDDVQEVFARLGGHRSHLMDLDFLFVDQRTLDKMIPESRQVVIVGRKFLIPSLLHLIALKLHAMKHNLKIRELKDLPDIVDLIRVHRVNVRGKEFKEVCLKYGSEEIYRKVLHYVL